jgi:hypothetical protein
MAAVFTLNGTALDHVPDCLTRAVPDVALAATVATTWVSLQLTTPAKVLPSHTAPLACVGPKSDPEMVTCTPAAPVSGDTPLTLGGSTRVYVPAPIALAVIPLLYAIARIVVVALTATAPV